MVYWYIALDCRPPMRMSCPGCRKVAAPEILASLGRRRLMISIALDFALIQRLQRDIDEAAVGGALAAGEAHHVLDAGVGLDDADGLLHGLAHGVERGVLRTLQAAHGGAVVLLREEALGDPDQAEDVEPEGDEEDDEYDAGVVEHPDEALAIAADEAVEDVSRSSGTCGRVRCRARA